MLYSCTRNIEREVLEGSRVLLFKEPLSFIKEFGFATFVEDFTRRQNDKVALSKLNDDSKLRNKKRDTL